VVEIDKCDPKALAEVKSSIADNATCWRKRLPTFRRIYQRFQQAWGRLPSGAEDVPAED
jgi:hypothetical protein